MNMKEFNGYSVLVVGSSPAVLSKRVRGIHFYPSFLDNFNAMLLLMFAVLFVAIVLFFLTKAVDAPSKTLIKVTNKLLK
jgi:hypothetical protein